MVHYQSISAATHHANTNANVKSCPKEHDDEVKVTQSMVRRIGGALLLFVGLVGIARTYSFDRISEGTPLSSSAAALLRSATTTVAGGTDQCCAPATGAWNGVVGSQQQTGPKGDSSSFESPFESCYVHTGCDTSELMIYKSSCFCWSKSYYDDGWYSCFPKGYGAAWQVFTKTRAFDVGDFGDGAFCGTTPCQDFDSDVPTC